MRHRAHPRARTISEPRTGGPFISGPLTGRLLTGRRGIALAAAGVFVAVAAVVVIANLGRFTNGTHPEGGPRTGSGLTSTSAGAALGAGPSPSASSLSDSERTARCVATTMAGLSLEDRVGQLLMIGTPVATPANLAPTIRRYRLGGAFLAGRSTRSSASIKASVQELQHAVSGAIPLHVAVDQEGGRVQTLGGARLPDGPLSPRTGHLER